jgi:hypothetical protein
MPETPEQLERGDIFFFYRPKVEQEAAGGIDDVQRFVIVLRTAGGRLFRLLTIGRKHLPDLQAHEREWGFVDLVAREPEPVADALRATTYSTKTRGLRHLAAARPAGEGAYALQRDGGDLILAYRLELPTELGPVQKELGIAQEAAFVVALKNPQVPNPPNIGLREDARVHFPAKEQGEFHGTRWSAADKHLLDFERAEFVLIGATDHPSGAPAERAEPKPEAVLRRLRLSPRDTPLEPLVQGVWA